MTVASLDNFRVLYQAAHSHMTTRSELSETLDTNQVIWSSRTNITLNNRCTNQPIWYGYQKEWPTDREAFGSATVAVQKCCSIHILAPHYAVRGSQIVP